MSLVRLTVRPVARYWLCVFFRKATCLFALTAALGASSCIEPADCGPWDPACDASGILGLNVLYPASTGRLQKIVFGNIQATPIEVYALDPDSLQLTLLGTNPSDLDHMWVNQTTNKIYLMDTSGGMVREMPLSGGAAGFSFDDVAGGNVTGLTTTPAGDVAFYSTATLGLRRALLPGGTSATTLFPGAATDALPAYDSVSNTVYLAETLGVTIRRIRVSDGVAEAQVGGLGGGGTILSVPPVGEFIYYTVIADATLSRIPRAASVTPQILASGLPTPTGAAIDTFRNVAYVCALDTANPRIMRVDLATGASTTLLSLPVTGRAPGFCTGVY
jgi:hypothetical protein